MVATGPMTPEQERCAHAWRELGTTADLRSHRLECAKCGLIHDVNRRIAHEDRERGRFRVIA